jgi:hypothetical protein
LIPFFFLLLDSLPLVFEFEESWLALASVPLAAAFEPSAGFASPPGGVPVVVVVVTAFVAGSAAAGAGAGAAAAFGSPVAPGGLVPVPSLGCAAVPSVEPLVFEPAASPPDAPFAGVPVPGPVAEPMLPGLPGVTTSTTDPLPAAGAVAPRVDRLPGVRMSVAEVLSD